MLMCFKNSNKQQNNGKSLELGKFNKMKRKIIDNKNYCYFYYYINKGNPGRINKIELEQKLKIISSGKETCVFAEKL